MIGAYGIRIVPSEKWRLIDLSQAYHGQLVVEQIRYQVGVRHWDWGELHGFSFGEVPRIGIYTWYGLCKKWILWVMLGRSLWLIGHSRSEGRQAGGRSDIGRVIILVWGILVHAVVRGLLGTWPCGCCGHGMGVSLLFLCSTCPRLLLPELVDTA